MYNRLIIVFFILASLSWFSQLGYAQENTITIVQFASSLDSISLAEAEQEQTISTFTWSTYGLTENHTLDLQIFQAGEWQSVLDLSAETLLPQGQKDLIVQHSQTFAPPAYRLVILDSFLEIVDQWIITIPYAQPSETEEPPFVELNFSTDIASVTPNAEGTGLIPANWEVINRQPTTQLYFSQVLADGSLIPISILEPHVLWVPSTYAYDFEVAIGAENMQIQLRVDLYNLLDETLISQRTLLIPVVHDNASTSRDNTSINGHGSRGGGSGGFIPGEGPPAYVTASVSPTEATYGQAVTIMWALRDANLFMVTVDTGAGSVQIFETSEPGGTIDYILPAGSYSSAHFTLTMTNSEGISRSRTVSITIN